MKRFKVYTISLVAFVLVTTLAVGFRVPETLYNRYPVWADPLINNEVVRKTIEDSGVEVIWLQVIPANVATISVGVPRDGFTKEQTTAIGKAMGILGNQYNLPAQVVWIWSGRPANSWTVGVCKPDGCQNIGNDIHLDKNDWQHLIIDRGWVR